MTLVTMTIIGINIFMFVGQFVSSDLSLIGSVGEPVPTEENVRTRHSYVSYVNWTVTYRRENTQVASDRCVRVQTVLHRPG